MMKILSFISFLALIQINFFDSVKAELEGHLGTPKIPRLSSRPARKRSTARKTASKPNQPPKAPVKHLYGVSMSSLTGYEKPGMPIKVIDFDGPLPVGFNATNHIVDLPMKNHLKILVDPEDVDWSRQQKAPII